MKPLRRFLVTARVELCLRTVVEATSAVEAKQLAKERRVQLIPPGNEAVEWSQFYKGGVNCVTVEKPKP